MRALALVALLLPQPVMADQILASSKIISVTLYPEGAQVTRDITFTAPAGPHDLLIADLPSGIVPDLIRLASPDLQLGAFSLRNDRLPPRDEATNPALVAAKAGVEAATLQLATAQAAIDAINARVESAEAQAAFLKGIKAEGGNLTVEALQGIAQMVGTQTLTARQAALAAQADLPAAQKGVTQAQETLAKALAAQEALSQRDENFTALSVAFQSTAAGEAHLTLTHYVENASWRPVYDLNLTRKDTPSLTISRGVLVSQSSGEDWADVSLTLSTAQPSDQSEPSQLYAQLRRIGDPEAPMPALGKSASEGDTMAAPVTTEAMMEPVVAAAELQGDVVVYVYPSPVSVASGVEDLRLALDEKITTPTIEARAIPRYDQTAFLLASFTNDTGEILLPGQAFLSRDHTLVGSAWLTGVAPGDEYELGFGAIEGLRLKRDEPKRLQGDRGIISSSTQIAEEAVLQIENLSTESWPVKLMDQVPYSEQEDLEISFTADPMPVETDVDGQRGVLAWTFDLPAGAKKEVALNSLISWPSGKVLQ